MYVSIATKVCVSTILVINRYKIKCEMMTDKDTKCMIRVGHTRHDASVTKTTFGIHVSVI